MRKTSFCKKITAFSLGLMLIINSGNTTWASKLDNAKEDLENAENNIEDAKENAKRNNIKNCEFYCGDAKEAVKILKEKNIEPDAVILDPPRKGCDREVLEYVAEMKPKKIVYVSCDPVTLARDIKVLSELYEVKDITLVDMFPNTKHVECVCLLKIINDNNIK